jgi:hypothetical protein
MTKHSGRGRKKRGGAAKGGVNPRSRLKKAPIVRNNSRRRENADLRMRELLTKTQNSSHRASVIADGIIRISAQEGIPIQDLIDSYMRRLGDAPVMIAIQKRLDFMGRVHGKKGKK